jgi:flagellar basal-body rod modification protein FlgD
MNMPPLSTFANVSSTRTQTQGMTDSNGFVGKNDFFKILAAQLKYQDPMSGGDNSAYIAQMSQFAMIEKLENLADQISTLYNLNATQNAVSMIGKDSVMDTLEAGRITGRIERIEIAASGLNYVVDGKSYAYPTLISVGMPETEGRE